MTLEEKVQKKMVAAMKAKDKDQLRTLRAIKSELLLLKTDGSGDEVDEAKELKLIQKMVKSRQESMDIYQKENREDLAEKEAIEIEHIKAFLPAQLSTEEVTAAITAIIEETGASSMADMGKVMGIAQQKIGGQADGKTIAQIVKQVLAS
ncbi:GatB/YqeY domain-containing protein [Membranihabitans marinus]|uniref:GatB/YqeY domain-containing protein n=1 Tax=Membranihabitans marinus TaxID=1227546 RepID=UPI001F2D0A57|nr:GatB/YqeY domain-containing protein [Membranihabitans marinus]